MARKTDTTTQYVADFEQAIRADVSAPSWLRSLRAEAMQKFGDAGFPTTRDEEWRFTSVAPIAETRFIRAANGVDRVSRTDVGPSFSLAGPDGRTTKLKLGPTSQPGPTSAAELVFVNGRLASSLSRTDALPAGALVADLKSLLASRPATLEPFLSRTSDYQNQPFAALNTAFLEDGAVVWIPANQIVDQPVHLVFVASPDGLPSVSYPRVLIVAEDNSQLQVVEIYAGPQGATYFTNGVSDVFLGSGAILDHYKIQEESAAGYHVGRVQARLQRDSRFASHSISFGGALVRNDVVAVMEDEGADCTLNGLYLVDGQRLIDNHTTIDHARAHCTSHEIYKGILAEKARAVFNGKIVVRPDAQKTDAKQTNKALLLSDDALINSKPQLEIFANDVKCTHGAAVGQLDDDAIFYLRTRGISLDEARTMLIHAFASDILNRVRIETLRTQLEQELTRGLRS